MRKGKLRQVSHVFTHGDLEKVRGYIKPEGKIIGLVGRSEAEYHDHGMKWAYIGKCCNETQLFYAVNIC